MAVVGCLPACKSVVSLIMILPCKPLDRTDMYIRKSVNIRAELVMAYEMYMTFYEKKCIRSMHLRSAATQLSAYSSDPKIDAAFMEEEAQKILRSNGLQGKCQDLYQTCRPFLERLDSMNAHRGIPGRRN